MTSTPVKAVGLSNKSYLERIAALHQELLIPSDYATRGLTFHYEADELVVGELDPNGKEMLMEPRTAESWRRMKEAAAVEAVVFFIEHAYRSVEVQANIIRAESARGSSLEKSLTCIAAPGYSEHHTGRALDIACPGCLPVPQTDEFERTVAFAWLTEHANKFGFFMSYPRNNPQGIMCEPWHWCFHQQKAQQGVAGYRRLLFKYQDPVINQLMEIINARHPGLTLVVRLARVRDRPDEAA